VTFRSLFHGMAARACLILVTALCTQASAEGLSPAAQAHLSALQATARQQHLAGSAMWRALLHYRVQPLTRRDRSLADDPDFFLSSDGARDAQHELDATLAAFFYTRPSHALNQAASCRFMARYQWLDAQLHFEHPAMPEPVCERYRQWRSGINADTVTLIFPSAYLNSPASMYGHTFLRLDPKREPGQASSPLLAYAVNYAANGDENDGLAFAFRGLTGLYAGAFTNAPYYLRIRDYNDLENRDIWEYELNLSAPEIERLLAHTWELGPTRFDYYFFDENCSYHLLSLLDSARPELALSDRFTWWAIPLDTVRAVTDTPGLLRSMHYRAANSTELRLRASQLSPVEAGLAQQLSAGTLKPEALAAQVPSAPQRALILETAERLTAFNATRGDSTEEIAQRQRMALLGARAALPSTAPLVVPTPEADPTQGHDTARVDVMLGQRNGHGAVRLQARPAYHDLLDPERGYQRGAAIQFFSVELGKDTNKRVQLERFTPVEISSLSPREPLLSAKSWRVHIGLERSAQARPDGQRPLGVNLNGGPGLAVELNAQQTLMAYALLDNQARWDRSLTHRPWAFGSGVATGVLADLSAQWRVQAEVFGRAYLAGQPAELGASVQMRYSLGKAWNAAGQCALSQRHGQHVSQSCMVGFQHYN
jgi:hypothetical protein